ncbi:MAG TPA: FixH family protein [Gaiellaceae bacterium]|nr:FixH family protein [Gaiellaceae bacterium]
MRLLALTTAALLAASTPAAAARHVGPGPVQVLVPTGRYTVAFDLTPNLASRTGTISVSLRRGVQPIAGARVRMTVTMLDMNMGGFTVQLHERAAGMYTRMFPVVGMSGRWGFRLDVRPPHGRAFSVALADRMLG